MANPFLAAGASLEKAPRYAPLHSNEFFTGFFTNRNPLRDPATPFLDQKFYSATRYDSIIAGLNIEISPRLTPIRRYGNSVYNSQTFSNVQNFYSFRVTNTYTTPPTQSIRVIVDTATAVYDGTGPSGKTLLFTKSSGAGQTSFQAVGNTLYMGDGVDVLKWVWFPSWVANNEYTLGQVIIDSNNNLQEATSFTSQTIMQGSSLNKIRVSVSLSGLLSVSVAGTWTTEQLAQLVGETATFSAFTTATFLNGQSVTISSAYNSYAPPNHFKIFTANTAFSPVTLDQDSAGIVMSAASGTGESGSSAPAWATSPGATTSDNQIIWTCKGPSVEQWGINAPTQAPGVSNQLAPVTNGWAASTFYWVADQLIVDSNSNIQLLTTPGTTGTVPSWATTPGVTTTDGSGGGAAVWTCQGPAARATTTAYPVGAYILVSWATTTVSVIYNHVTQSYTTITRIFNNLAFFKSSTAGTTSSTTTSALGWNTGKGAQTVDGGVTWTFVDYEITRVNSATVPATRTTTTVNSGGDITVTTTIVAGNIGNTQLVSTFNEITDSNEFFETVQTSGESGSTAPTWGTTLGSATPDNTVVWLNAGPSSAANTGTWIYGFAYKNSITGHISSSSPASTPITLAQNSYISVSGPGDPNWSVDGVDTIEIYRSAQGATTLFWLADISAPLNGAPWNYGDFSPDPPNPLSTLNEFIEADTTGNNAPPTAGLIALSYHLNRVWGAVTETSYYSAAPGAGIGVGAESFPGLNYFDMPTTITVHWATSAGMFFYLVRGVYLSNGVDGNGNPLSPVSIPNDDVGVLTPNCFTVVGSTPIYLTTDLQCLQDTPGVGTSRIAFQIEDKLQSLSASSACLAWHTNGPDQALYVCDGSTGWYRGILTPAPESSGTTWAPFSVIAGGVECIKSIETQPGLKHLLLGAGEAGGPILYRDTTTNSDNGTLYTANFTIGSLVLAQSGQCAEVGYLTTESLATGTRPAITVLVDEISGTFESLPNRIPDPPFLVDSTSIYSDRWYFNQLNEPAWMHHMQVNFAWPAENHANELMTYTIWGCIHQEE